MRCLVWQMMKLPLLLDFGYGKNSNFAAVKLRKECNLLEMSVG